MDGFGARRSFCGSQVIGQNGRKRTKNTRCSFHCNCLILGEVARPERFELPAFRFVGRSAKTSKCRYSYRLRAKRATYSALKLDGSWTEPKMWCARESIRGLGLRGCFRRSATSRPKAGSMANY